MIAVGNDDGSVAFYLGDQRLALRTGIDTRPFPFGFERMVLTALGPFTQNADLFFDSVAVSREPLLCP